MLLNLSGLGIAWGWFCSLLVIETIVLLFLVENNKPGWAGFSLIATSGFVKWLTGISVFELVWHNPGKAVIASILYFIIGTLWSIGKWYLYVNNRREQYNNAKAFHHVNALAGAWENSWKYKRFLNRSNGLAPLVRDNKSRVMTWMIYWPWTMGWTLINEPIKKVFKAIYNRIHNSLQAISNNAFKDV